MSQCWYEHVSLFVPLLALTLLLKVTDLILTTYLTGGNETVGRMIDCLIAYSAVQFIVRALLPIFILVPLTSSPSYQGIYPTLMIVTLERSVWNTPAEVHASPPRSALSTMQFSGGAQRAVPFADLEHARRDRLSAMTPAGSVEDVGSVCDDKQAFSSSVAVTTTL